MVRQEVGHQVFLIVLNRLLDCIRAGEAADAAEALEQLSQEDPNWVMNRVREEVNRRGLWVLERGSPRKRLANLKYFSWTERLKLLPSALAAYTIDHLVCLTANRRMRRDRFAVSGRRH